MNLLFVDTETNGIPHDQSASFKNIDNWPTIRQIAWIVYSKDGQLVSAYNYAMSADMTSQPIKESSPKGVALLDFVANFKSTELVPFIDRETGEEYSRMVCKDQFEDITFVNMSSQLPELHKSNAEAAQYIVNNASSLQVVPTDNDMLILCKQDKYTFSDLPNYKPRVFLPIHKVLDIFQESLQQCDVIIGHNIEYDVKVILSELYRYGKETDGLELIQQFCTMRQTVKFCGFETNNGDRFPKLQELYSKLFHQPFENAHDAYCDVKATAECFGALFNKGFLDKKDYPFLLSDSEKTQIIEEYLTKAKEIVDELLNNNPHSWRSIDALTCFDRALELANNSTTIKTHINDVCFECAKELYSSDPILGEVLAKPLFEKSGTLDYMKELNAKHIMVDVSEDEMISSNNKFYEIEPEKEIPVEHIIQEMKERNRIQREAENFIRYGKSAGPDFWDKAANVFYIVFGILLLIAIISALL